MSRDKSVWFAEEILLDAKLINVQLEHGEWESVEEMLRAEAQLSKDPETGRLRPKKASEYTLRLIAEVLHIMRLDIEQASYNLSTLAVAEQCLRLIRSCAASGTKMQTYISKELNILDSMLVIATEYQHPSVDYLNETLMNKYDSLIVILMQTLGNLVVNNPFNQIIIWDKFVSIILNSLVSNNNKIGTAVSMIIYNILLGRPNVLPDDAFLLNSLAYMYNSGNTEYPHLIIEYLIGVENNYLEKLYAKLDIECRVLILNLTYNILISYESQDTSISVNFVKFICQEFKSKSDLILKTVDKYVNSIEPQEIVYLLDIISIVSCMDCYINVIQSDASLFINCAFLLRAIHKLGKESDNYFTSLNKLYATTGKQLDKTTQKNIPLSKNNSADNMLSCNETISECTESESSELFFECTDMLTNTQTNEHTDPETQAMIDSRMDALARSQCQPETRKISPASDNSRKVSQECSRKVSLEHKIDIDDLEPPLIVDNATEPSMKIISEVIPVNFEMKAYTDFTRQQPNNIVETSEAQNTQKNSDDVPTTTNELTPQNTLTVESLRCTVDNSKSAEPHIPGIVIKQQCNLSINDVNDAQKTISDVQPSILKSTKSSIEGQTTESQSADCSPNEEPKCVTIEERKPVSVSTEFDLNEQLQKILGTDKCRKEVKIAEKIPTVQIDSPDGQKTRLGNIDTSTSKTLTTSVESVEQHVAFGFKATLVRVIANMCWKHQINKRMIRELEVIPVLLDCCNIDTRNPLIMQWVIFAVRNLCENCPENQELINKLTLEGVVDNELLKDMGISLQTDGQSVKVAPKD